MAQPSLIRDSAFKSETSSPESAIVTNTNEGLSSSQSNSVLDSLSIGPSSPWKKKVETKVAIFKAYRRGNFPLR